jgi:uncharacterized protein YneF (UPF0154 family)
MKQIYFIITLVLALTIGIISLNLGITFAQNETSSEIENSPLITTEQIDELMETNNASPQPDNKTLLIE